MSTSGISSTDFSQLDMQFTCMEQITAEFSQLGSDLQSGNLPQAQQDFVTLANDALNSPLAQAPGATSPSSAASTATGTISPASSASQSALMQDFQTLSQIEVGFQNLGQALQSGNLAGAQQAFAQLTQNESGAGAGSSSVAAGRSGLNVSA